MEVKELIEKYLQEVKVMQLATTADNQPWACNVHFVVDDELNLYWISKSSRRHSQEIAKNKKVSAVVAIKFPEHPVVGISVEGDAETVSSADALDLYDRRFGLSQDFKKNLSAGLTEDKLFRLNLESLSFLTKRIFPSFRARSGRQGILNKSSRN
jgi:uncharacterized protein YhbP (UPF0306 family)